jgi:rubrerythrin
MGSYNSSNDALNKGGAVMSDKADVSKLFELAIAAERTNEELFFGLAAKFAHYQPVADFWVEYAQDEAIHAQSLEQIRDALSPEQLSAPADPYQLENAYKALRLQVKDALTGIDDLEEAYQLAHEMEHAETNAVFEFLISNFSADQQTQSFLRSQLGEHIAKLIDGFPAPFKRTARRREIRALE